MTFEPDRLSIVSLTLLAIGLLLAGAVLVAGERRTARTRHVVDRAIRASVDVEKARDRLDAVDPEEPADGMRIESELPVHWLGTRLGHLLVADEDRRLIDQCGWPSVKAQLLFLVARCVLAIAFPIFAWLLVRARVLPQQPSIAMAVAFMAGFMLPKWFMARAAARRRACVADELPLFVDLLRLLQGVGMSLDQSLHVIAEEFAAPLPVLGGELAIANRQYAQGRTREHSLQRLATLHQNESLAGLIALLVQVVKHGGAVQEPLMQYSERLREDRRSDLKDRIGKITVKMTGVMVVTLLPALVIVAAGPGFLALVRSLGAISR